MTAKGGKPRRTQSQADVRKGPRPEAVEAILARCAEWMIEQEEAAAQAGRSPKQKTQMNLRTDAQVPA